MNCSIQKDHLHVILPITTPTGKVRVKRPVPGAASEPVACRTKSIENDDYLEWQISYDTDSLNEPSVLPEVELRKPQGIRYGCELIWLLKKGREAGLITAERVDILSNLINSSLAAGIEESEKIERTIDSGANTVATSMGFQRHYLHVPNYIKVAHSYAIEIKIAHKQRAVGNQAMIYVNIPVARCEPLNTKPLIGRIAEQSEQVRYVIDSKNSHLIDDAIIAFSIASQSHRADLKAIFEKL